MKVLISGASGFIGRYVLDVLRQEGIDVVTIGRSEILGGVKCLSVDLLKDRRLGPVLGGLGATHLLHLAWYVEHGKYWTSPLNLNWVGASVRLVEAFCDAGGEKVVVAGTCAEYDWKFGYCREETTPLEPATLYGSAKDATRRLTMAICAIKGIPITWGRIFLPFGNGEASGRLIPSLIDVFRGRRPPFGVNGESYRDFLHVADVAGAFVNLLRCGGVGEYNICSGEPTRLSELVTTLAEMCSASPAPVLDRATSRPGEPQFLVGENLKLKATGWRPKMTLARGLEVALRESERSRLESPLEDLSFPRLQTV